MKVHTLIHGDLEIYFTLNDLPHETSFKDRRDLENSWLVPIEEHTDFFVICRKIARIQGELLMADKD